MLTPQLQLASLHRDPLSVLTDLHANKGDLARFWLGRQRCYSLNSAELVEDVFVGHRLDVGKRNSVKRWWMRSPPSHVRGELFQTHDEEEHTRARKHFNRTFSSQHALLDAERASAVIARIYGEASTRRSVDLLGLLEKALLIACMSTLLDREPSEDEAEEMIELQRQTISQAAIFMPSLPAVRSRIFRAERRRAGRAHQSLEELFARFVHEHPAERPSALSARVRCLEGSSRPAASLLLTGVMPMVEQAAPKLCHALLAQAADVQVAEQLNAEVDELGGQPVDADALARLPAAFAAADESLRFLPLWAIGRVCQRSFSLEGQCVRRGDWLLAPAGLIHLDPRYWPDPKAYRLDRWTADQVATRPKGAYFPFGFGNRICVARHLSRILIASGVATFVRDWRLELLSAPPEWQPIMQGDWIPTPAVRARLLTRTQV
jgi:enediyne biosynthesis protein E7